MQKADERILTKLRNLLWSEVNEVKVGTYKVKGFLRPKHTEYAEVILRDGKVIAFQKFDINELFPNGFTLDDIKGKSFSIQ